MSSGDFLFVVMIGLVLFGMTAWWAKEERDRRWWENLSDVDRADAVRRLRSAKPVHQCPLQGQECDGILGACRLPKCFHKRAVAARLNVWKCDCGEYSREPYCPRCGAPPMVRS